MSTNILLSWHDPLDKVWFLYNIQTQFRINSFKSRVNRLVENVYNTVFYPRIVHVLRSKHCWLLISWFYFMNFWFPVHPVLERDGSWWWYRNLQRFPKEVIEDDKDPSRVWGWFRKIRPEDHRLASRGLPSDDKRWSRGTDFSIPTSHE